MPPTAKININRNVSKWRTKNYVKNENEQLFVNEYNW